MKDELEKEVLDEETSDDSFFDDLDEEQDKVEEEEQDESYDEEDEEEEKPKDKLDTMSAEDIKKAYKNLEALVGKQGQELGELRKKVTEAPKETKKDYSENDIPEMPDDVLDKYIAIYEQKLTAPNAAIEDSEQYGVMNVQFQKLLAEKNVRRALSISGRKTQEESNSAVVKDYKSKAGLTDEEAKQAREFAEKRLSDNGKITQDDLDVAIHKLFPEKYIKMRFDKEKERLAKAKTRTPTIPTSKTDSGTAKLSIEKINSLDPDEYDNYIDSLSDKEFAELKKMMNK